MAVKVKSDCSLASDLVKAKKFSAANLDCARCAARHNDRPKLNL